MRTTALGHAGLKVETEDAVVLIDPWFSPEGAFQASWFPYPDNSQLMRDPSLHKPSAVVVSHEHLDHVDPWFLSRVPADVPVYIPTYASPALRRKVAEGGVRDVIEVPAWQDVAVAPGVSVLFVPEPSPMNHDSAIIVKGDGHTLLDLNDARLSPLQLREARSWAGGSVDMFAFQGAGASWYPMCYEYPEERRQKLSQQKRMAKLAYAQRASEIVAPVVGLPFAGPPCFLDPELFVRNDEMDQGIFPDQYQVQEWLAGAGLHHTAVLLPGDAWDAGSAKLIPAERQDDPFGDRQAYLESYAERRRPNLAAVLSRHPEPVTSLWEDFREYFEHLLELSPYFNRRIGMAVGFDVLGEGGGQWAVDFRPGSEGVSAGIDRVGYRFRFASRWLPSLLDGSVPWEDFLLSLRFSAWREPDLYNDHLLGLLKFADGLSLRAVEGFETAKNRQEWVTVGADGDRFEIERYCPHAGNDLLETGQLLPGGVLRCLAHHYEFRLDTGRCLNGVCRPLKTRRQVT